MIQLPSKIRTTLFNIMLPAEPYEVFPHEDDRLLVTFYVTGATDVELVIGRTMHDVLNLAGIIFPGFVIPIFYGPEPLWVTTMRSGIQSDRGGFLFHGVYRT